MKQKLQDSGRPLQPEASGSDWRIVIDFALRQDSGTLVHQVRNLGEELYRLYKYNGWASISLDEVDRATNQLTVIVRSKRRVRRVSAMTHKLLEKHFLARIARITEVKVERGGRA